MRNKIKQDYASKDRLEIINPPKDGLVDRVLIAAAIIGFLLLISSDNDFTFNSLGL